MSTLGPIGFNHGLISNSSVFNSPKDSLYTCNGFRYFYGSLQEHNGVSKFNSVAIGTGAGVITGIFPNSLSTESMVATADTKIYSLNSSGTATDITGAATLSGAGTRNVTADVLNGIMVVGDPHGGDWCFQWNGTGNAAKLVAAPDGSTVCTVNNFMFITGVDAAKSTFYWSAVSDPTTWPVASNLTFRQGDGDRIRALSFIGSDLFIFKDNAIGRLSATSVTVSGTGTLGPLQTVSVGIGCLTNKSVARLPDGRIIFFGTNNHAYILDGSNIVDIGEQGFPNTSVQDIFNTTSGTVHVSVYPPRSEAYFIYTTGACMIYNYQLNLWSKAATTPSFTTSVFILTSNTTTLTPAPTFGKVGSLVAADPTAGFIYELDVPASTEVYTAQWNTSVLVGGEGRKFTPRSLLMEYKSATSQTPTMTVSYGFDGGTIGNGTTVTTASTYARLVKRIVIPNTPFSTIQIQVQGQSGVHGVQVEPFWLSDEMLL